MSTSKVIFLHYLEVRLSIWFLHTHCMIHFISQEFGAHVLAEPVQNYHHSPFESGLQITSLTPFSCLHQDLHHIFSFYSFNKSIVKADHKDIFSVEDGDINPALMCSLESLQGILLEDLFLLQEFSQIKHTPGSSLKIPLFPESEVPWEICYYIRW